MFLTENDSFSIENNFYDKMDWRPFSFSCDYLGPYQLSITELFCENCQ